MRAAKTKAGGGSDIHRLAAAKAKGTIRPNPKGKEEHGEVYSDRGENYGTHVQPMKMDGAESKHALGRKRGGRADGGKWIQDAVKHPGALHEELHVPAGKKIPAAKLAKASHSENPTLRRRAALAKTLKGLHH
jgi:hypothetical protein